MYIVISIALFLIGVFVLLLGIKRFRGSTAKGLPLALIAIGLLLAITGVIFLILLLSGRLTLPLVK